MPSGRDLELAADPAQRIQERHDLALLGALDEDVAVRGDGRRRERRDLDAVGQQGVLGAAQLRDAFDDDRPVDLDGDQRAHLLQAAGPCR